MGNQNIQLLKRLNFLTIFSVVYYFFFLNLFGEESLVILNLICMSIYCIYLKEHFKNYLYIIPLIYLLFFDNPNSIIKINGINLRSWYFIVLIIYFLLASNLAMNLDKVTKFLKTHKEIFVFLIIFTFSNIFILFDQNSHGYFHQIKTLAFSFGLILILVNLCTHENIDNILVLILYLILFVFIWSIIQKLVYEFHFMLGLNFTGDAIQHNWGTKETPAFFSERTWIGQFLIFGIILSYYLYMKKKNNLFFILAFVFSIGVFLSLSRSGIFPLMLILIYFSFKFLLVEFSKIRIFYTFFLIFLGLIVLFFLNYLNIISFETIMVKFSNPLGHRKLIFINFWNKLEAIDYLKILFGQGYNWDNEVTFWGSAMGSKSVNIMIRVFHTYGIIGIILFLYLNTLFLKKIIISKKFNYELEVSCLLFLFFISLSFFVPVDFYPPTHLFLIISIVLLNNDKKLKNV